MCDPARKAKADRYRLKLIEQYRELRELSEEELIKRELELNQLLDSMGYFDGDIEEVEPEQKTTLVC